MSQADIFQQAVADIASNAALADRASYSWGMVTGVDPLEVKRDVDALPLSRPPDNLIGPLVIGDRVYIALVDRRFVVLGRSGGPGVTLRVFPTLSDAEAANLPIGSMIYVTAGNVQYVKTADNWAKFITDQDQLVWQDALLEPFYNNNGGTAGRLQLAYDGLTVWVRGGTDGPRVNGEYTRVARVPPGIPTPHVFHRVGVFGGGGRVAGLEIGPDGQIKQVIRDPIAATWISASTSYPAT